MSVCSPLYGQQTFQIRTYLLKDYHSLIARLLLSHKLLISHKFPGPNSHLLPSSDIDPSIFDPSILVTDIDPSILVTDLEFTDNLQASYIQRKRLHFCSNCRLVSQTNVSVSLFSQLSICVLINSFIPLLSVCTFFNFEKSYCRSSFSFFFFSLYLRLYSRTFSSLLIFQFRLYSSSFSLLFFAHFRFNSLFLSLFILDNFLFLSRYISL
ncbi:unnamed protein product [Meloidogyne enterolobii]|uniref:Uncharacterized protein n=1 Tax=Meloidogyne enterolobii TaxID=390850 RepID=A0ACB0XU44_MELEN